MKLSRRQFFHTATGALAFGSSLSLLAKAGIADEAPIKVANILDRTGGINIYCLKQIKAAAMAVDEINAAGGLLGRPIELIFYDSQSNNRLNSQYTTEAFVRDKVDVVHGAVTSSAREVMRPVVNRFKGLYFYNAMYEGGVCDKRCVCTGLVPSQNIEPVVDYVINERGGKKSYILAADYNYGQITSKWMQKYIREKGGEDIAVEFFPLDVTNFTPVISRIQSAKPDVVYSALVGDAHTAFYTQFESTIGKDKMMLASTTYGLGRENTSVAPEVNDGIIIATSFFDGLDTEAAKSFVSKFKEYTGEDDYISEYGEYGYRGMMLWAEAVKKAGGSEPEKVIPALGGTKFSGAGGLYTIDGQTNHTIMDVHIVVGNKNKGFDLLKSFSQRQPTYMQSVCNLIENPETNKQFEPEI